jgi:L-ascorbate metabolism protein UlaG (beta-lactamase superfamily)
LTPLPQSDVASWFSTQRHTVPRKVENLARQRAPPSDPELSPIDAVVVSHQFTDHCHKQTLLDLPPTLSLLAPSQSKGAES